MIPIRLLAGIAAVLIGATGLRADTVATTVEDEPITLILDVGEGGRIQYSGGNKKARLTGGGRIWVDIPDLEPGSVVILAEEVEADLELGIVTVPLGAQLLMGPAVLVGDRLELNAARRDFTMERARGYLAMPAPDGRRDQGAAKAYFKSKRIVKRGDLTNLHRAILTTCPKDNPDFYIQAKRIKYDASQGAFFIYNAKLRVHGVTIPLFPWLRMGLNKTRVGRGYDFDAPGYSSREGLYLPGALRILPPESSWEGIARFRLTTREDVVGTLLFRREAGPWDILARASRRERVADDITDELAVYRVPELSFTRHFKDRDDCETALDLNLGFGRFGEDVERVDGQVINQPQTWEHRAIAELAYTTNACAYADRAGNWYGADARASTYSSGETYRDLELFAGIGGQVSGSLHLDTTLRHHLTAGSTPFLFDDVDIETELETGFDLAITDRWRLHGWSRFDANEGDWRDYQATLAYRAGCLTYGLYYRDVGDRIGFRVDLTGLTGDTKPLQKQSSLEKEMAEKGLVAKPLAPAASRLRPMNSTGGQGYRLFSADGPSDSTTTEEDMD